MRFSLGRVEEFSNFANKIWNASRFALMNIEGIDMPENGIEEYQDHMTIADKWIISKLNRLIKDVTENLEKFELGIAAQKIYDFIWFEFCDWYIELIKPRLYSDESLSKKAAQSTLIYALKESLKLLHPYMPFITEEIYQHLPRDCESIVISSWPQYYEKYELRRRKSWKIMEALSIRIIS